jgi:hypothetical protein
LRCSKGREDSAGRGSVKPRKSERTKG